MKLKQQKNLSFNKARLHGALDMITPSRKSKMKTKEEVIWNYLVKRCDTTYEARLMFNAIVRAMKSNRPTKLF